MNGQKTEENLSTSSTRINATRTASSRTIRRRQRIPQTFLLIWVDASVDESTEDCQNILAQLRTIINDVKIFTQPDECVQFLNGLEYEKAFVIASGSLGQDLLPDIHALAQLDTIYILCENKSRHENWTKQWVKIKGIHTDIKSICQALQQAAKQCNQDSIAVSFVTVNEGASTQNLDQLEPSFMYTQIFKDIILEMTHNEQSIKDFVQFWRCHYDNDTFIPKVVAEFERDYSPQSAITWYTRESFVFEMLNQSLRSLDGDTIINMGFFIRDLHEQIQELHRKQVDTHHAKSFIVYRGQGLLKPDFDKLVKTKNGLMSFNNFLSTSKQREVSLCFAKAALGNLSMVGILFKMTIDPSVSSTRFASIQEVSSFQAEEEILFSMHTVFRIGDINGIGNNDSLYQVDLKLTADDDPQLRTLTERIRKEVAGATGWQRLGGLLLKLKQLDKAEELYNVLLEQTSDEGEKALYYNQLGYIKDYQGDYQKAIKYYEKALEIRQKILPSNHPHLATSYNNIGSVYDNMGEYSKALSFDEKSLEIRQKTLPRNHPSLATSYNNIGTVYDNMGEYSKALSFYYKALEIRETTLPPNHPLLAASYNNIGTVYDNMGEYSKALSSHEKALLIGEKTLVPNHPNLATSYGNMGLVYQNMGEYSKALSFYYKALEIEGKTLPPNHPNLASSYNSIGGLYYNTGEYSKALSYFERALDILKRSLPANHPNIQTVLKSIEFAKKKL